MSVTRFAIPAAALALFAVAWVAFAPPESSSLPAPAALQPPASASSISAAPDQGWTVTNQPFSCQSTTCDADLWLPKGVSKPPVIVMAHGFGALKSWGLPAFAERFVKAGFAVYLFDYRGFGRSGGQPRNVVDGKEHVKDWIAAVDAVRQRPDVDGQRVGLWGTSYSGGAVLAVAAQKPDAIKAVSSQVPFVSGWSSALNYPIKYQLQATWYGLHDVVRGDQQTPLYVPTIAEHGFAALICPECWQGYGKIVPAGDERFGVVAARVFLSLPFYSPGSRADEIKAPVLLIAADHDGLIPINGVRKVAKQIAHVDYVELKGADHFAPYTGAVFEDVSSRQVAFFKKSLTN